MSLSFRRAYYILGPWRIMFLVFAPYTLLSAIYARDVFYAMQSIDMILFPAGLLIDLILSFFVVFVDKMKTTADERKAIWHLYVCPAVILGIIAFFMRGTERWFDFHYPMLPYGFATYTVFFFAAGLPWHLLFIWDGEWCPYCLTPRTKDNFDPEHHVCLRCHTHFAAENETANELSPIPSEKA